MLLTVPIVKIFPFGVVKNAGRNIFIDIFVSDGCLIFRIFEKGGTRGSVNRVVVDLSHCSGFVGERICDDKLLKGEQLGGMFRQISPIVAVWCLPLFCVVGVCGN